MSRREPPTGISCPSRGASAPFHSSCRRKQTHEILHEHRLAGAALSDDEVGLAVLEDGVDVLEDFLVPERLA